MKVQGQVSVVPGEGRPPFGFTCIRPSMGVGYSLAPGNSVDVDHGVGGRLTSHRQKAAACAWQPIMVKAVFQ